MLKYLPTLKREEPPVQIRNEILELVRNKAAPGFEPGMRILQTLALPLGYAAAKMNISTF